jgi:hypothetical protein
MEDVGERKRREAQKKHRPHHMQRTHGETLKLREAGGERLDRAQRFS